jgi:putative membrane protein
VAFDRHALILLLTGRWAALWHRLDGAFITVLLLGILTAIFSLASGIHWLLTHYPQPLWSFFTGLILISAVLLLREEVTLNRLGTLIGFTLGCCVAVGAALMPPVPFLTGLPGLFCAGAIAICAMILPGVSGSFMLVLMGMYEPVLSAIKSVAFTELLVFGLGCVTGLALFARLLKNVLTNYRALAMAFLSGVLMGSLVAVWPWRAEMLVSGGDAVVTLMRPVLPAAVNAPQTALCVMSFAAGLTLVWGVQALAARRDA